jgi:hypothetical protein
LCWLTTARDPAEVSQHGSLVAEQAQQVEAVGADGNVIRHHQHALLAVKEGRQSWRCSRQAIRQTAIAALSATCGHRSQLLKHMEHGGLAGGFKQGGVHRPLGIQLAHGQISLAG